MEYLEKPVSDRDSSPKLTLENIPDVSKHEATFNNNEKDEYGDTDVMPNVLVPPDCLTAVSMPKNWSQVERLKQQRLILHQQLFAQKKNVKNDKKYSETIKPNTESRTDGFEMENDDGSEIEAEALLKQRNLDNQHLYDNNTVVDYDTDTCSSDDDMPRLHIAESDEEHCFISQGTVSNDKPKKDGKVQNENIKTEKTDEESDENCSQKSLNSSDLCDLTASKINEALHNAISSVNVNKKHEKCRIKQVLHGLKMRAEEKENDNLGYRVSKALATAARPSNSSNGLTQATDKSFSLIENNPDTNLTLAKNNASITELNSTQYVGLSVNVNNVSKEFDYRNIALQKYLAEKRLYDKAADEINVNCEESSQRIQEGDKVIEKSMILDTSILSSNESARKESDSDFETKIGRSQLQKGQLEKEKNLRLLKHEIYQKRMQADGPRSHDLNESVLIAAKKMIEANRKLLEAEMKLNKHKLKMAENGISVFPCMPCHFIKDGLDDVMTNSEEEVDNIDVTGSPLLKNPSTCMEELQKSIAQNGNKTQIELLETNHDSNNTEIKAVSDQQVSSKTVISQDECADSPVRKTVKSLVPSQNLSLEKQALSPQDKPEKEAKKTGNITVKSKEKKIVKKKKSSKTRGIKKTRKSSSSVQKVSTVKTWTKSRALLQTKTDSSIDTPLTAKAVLAKNSPVIQTSSAGNSAAKCSTHSTENNSDSRPAQRIVIPQATIQQNVKKDPHPLVLGGVQDPSPSHGQSKHTDKFILPSGFVKDEATNRIFHTYYFSGHTFVVIDNKLYQIHMKPTEGKAKTVIGALIPTASSAVIANTRPKLANTSPVSSIAAATCSAPLGLRFTSASTTVASVANLTNNPVAYRFPVNVMPSAARTSQPLNLLIITTTPSAAATQSTQVIKRPLMNISGGNNIIRARLQMTLGQSVSVTTPVIANNPGLGLKLPVALPHSAVSPVNACTNTVIKTPVTLQAGTQPATFQTVDKKILHVSPSKSQLIYTTSPISKSQATSPAVKSLLTNKTYIMMDSAPAPATKAVDETRLPAAVATQMLEYCGSVVLSTALGHSTLPKKLSSVVAKTASSEKPVVDTTNESSTSDSGSYVVMPSEQNLNTPAVTKFDGMKALEQTPTKAESKKTKKTVCKEILQQGASKHIRSKYSLLKHSPAKICSSMDSFLYSAKRKRKGTPIKILGQRLMSSLHSKRSFCWVPPKTSEDKCQNNPADHNASAEDIENDTRNSEVQLEKICGPVPFLDYPARIVSTGKTGGCSKTMEIIASPKDTSKSSHSSDTSLDAEKMAKMIRFANMLQEETNEKGAMNEKSESRRIFKKRRTDSRNQEESFSKNEVTDSNTQDKSEKSVANSEELLEVDKDIEIPTCQEDKDTKNELVIPLVKDGENITLQQPAVDVVEDLVHTKEGNRNMFDEFEDFVSKENSVIESCNDSNDSYDSSDMENYEKFVSNQKHAPTIMKPKSQLIESYYISQGMQEEMKGCIVKPKQCFPVYGSYVTSRSSPKINELEMVEMNALKKPDLEKSKSVCLDSENSSKINEMNQDKSKVNLESLVTVETKPCSKLDIAQDISRKVNQKPLVTVGGRQVKKLIKTKFIILKGDICDRWFEIKRKTGFGEMSDPRFIHYLLRLEEERQTKMNQIKEAQTKTGTREGLLDEELATATEYVLQEKPAHGNGVVDFNNNNNADSSTDEMESYSDNVDTEDTLVNVTDTPENSPRLSELYTSDIECQDCSEKNESSQNDKLSETATSVTFNQEKLEDERTETSDVMRKSKEKPKPKYHSRKRPAAKVEDSDIPAAKKQFPILSDATKRQMRWAVSLFREWLMEKGEDDTQFEYRNSVWLDDKLAKFYKDALSHEGTPYSTDILQTFRRSLSLYLSSDRNSKNVHVSIAQDPGYITSNSVLSGLMLTETRRSTFSVSEHVIEPITKEDMEKLYTSRTLSDDDPTHLIWKVWFDITYHLCKGKLPRNFWRSLTKRSLVLESDVNGVFYMFADYVYLPPDEQPGKMYATPDEPEKCPVRSTSLYMSKLSANCDALFQCCKTPWNKQESWYWPIPMSREKLDRIIFQISSHANLSKVYDVSSVLLTARRNGKKV